MIVTNHAAVLVGLVSDTPNLQMTVLYGDQLTTPFRQDKIKTGLSSPTSDILPRIQYQEDSMGTSFLVYIINF